MRLNKTFTTEELLSKESQFLHDFDNEESVISSFQIDKDGMKDKTILYADYTYEDYSGDAYVLGYDNSKDKFFEVHGDHCSCYELEGQWEPEYYTIEQLNELLRRRNYEDKFGGYGSRYCSSSIEFKDWLS